jgi:hypothetical protein
LVNPKNTYPGAGNLFFIIQNKLYLRPLMNLLIKQVQIVDPSSSFNGQVTDIFIENGIIKQIGKNFSVQPDETNARGRFLCKNYKL